MTQQRTRRVQNWAACFTLALLVTVPPARAADDYKLGPDSQRQEGVPKGTVSKHAWNDSKIFPGTQRDYWVYVPAQYDKEKPACVLIVQDGGGAVSDTGSYRYPVVMDNLIHRKEMPVTIGIFINPGVIPPPGGDPKTQHPRFNRSFEYDTPSDQYARFLLEEILPEVGKSYNLTTEATGRALAGASSGAICAFTAAWERPAEFSRVISFIGSYTNLRRGHEYPSLIRKTEPKPIRVFLQDGSNDLDIYSGSWWVGNNDMAAALRFAGYEYQFVAGDGAHNGKHGGSILPDALRWAWRDYPKPPAKGAFPTATKDGRPTVMDVVIPGEEWQLVSEGHKFTEGGATDEAGNVYFTDIPNNRIHKIDAEGKVSVFAEDTGGANGLKFGPDGKLYACQGTSKRVVAYDKDGKAQTIAEDIECNDLVVARSGAIYVTEPPKKQVWYIAPPGEGGKREKRVVDKGIGRPNGITLTPDQSQLIVADTGGPSLYLFQVQPDGKLLHRQPYFAAHVPPMKNDSGADGIAVDTQGRLYVTTHAGLQVFDQAGRVNAIVSKPQGAWLANVAFGGKDRDVLYAMCGDKVFKRKTKVKGVLHFQDPLVPPAPRL